MIGPKKFISKLKKENELFRGYMQQDAHEFLNYLLNEISDTLEKEEKNKNKESNHNQNGTNGNTKTEEKLGGNTFIHQIFEGSFSSFDNFFPFLYFFFFLLD